MKIVKRVLVSILLSFCSLSLFSCGHEHSLMQEFNYDETNHWQECFECDETFNKEAHKFGEWKLNDSKTIEVRSCECGYSETRDYVDPHPTHSFTNYVNNNDATCTKNATETAKCDGCNKTDTREVPDSKTSHTFTNYVLNDDATCTKNATETAKCDNCDATDTREAADSKAPHSFTEYVNNNDATCTKNATETAKCDNCDETNTREVANSSTEHTYGELVAAKEANCEQTGNLAYYQCSVCEKYFTEEKVETTLENIILPITHKFGEWEVTKNPTFDEVGSKTRSCECGEIETEEVPVVVAVTEAAIENEAVTIEEAQGIILKVLVNPVDAENYKVEWVSKNEAVVKIFYIDGKYVAVAQMLANDVDSASAVVEVKVTNILNEVEYTSVTSSFEITVVSSNPIVEYTFDNGQIVNTGSNQEVTGRVTTLSGTNIVDPTSSVVYGTDVNGFENNAIKLEQKKEGGNHFTINGLDIGTGDFTIKTRMYISALITNSSSSCYIFGTGNETDENGNIKDVKSPYFNISYRLEGEQNLARVVANSSKSISKDSAGNLVFVPYGEWIEVYVVRSGNILTLIIEEVDGGSRSVISVELSSEDAVSITSTTNLGFLGNSGCQNGAPNNHTYFDYIAVYDSALKLTDVVLAHDYSDFINDNNATCLTNSTETSTCQYCGDSITREIENSKLEHAYGELVAKVDATCEEDGLAAHYQCSECGKYFDENKVETTLDALKIELKGHNYGELVAGTASSCDETGTLSHYQCLECEKYFTEGKVETTWEELQVTAQGHTYGELVSKVEPKCEEKGLAAYYQCLVCEKYFTEEKEETTLEALEIAESGHSYGELVSKVEPKCEEKGLAAHYQCSACEKYFTEGKEETALEALELAASGHTYGELVAKVSEKCEEDGLAAHYQCSECEKYFTEGKEEATLETLKIPANNHKLGEWLVTLYPTFEAVGSKTRTCVCGQQVETGEVPALVAATEVSIENDINKVSTDSTIILSLLVNPVDADSYKVEWTSNNESLVEFAYVDGVYKAIIKALPADKTSEKVTITVTLSNVVGDDVYSSVTSSFEITVVKPIVEYTFDNGQIVNTGSDQTVNGRITTMDSGSQNECKIIEVENPTVNYVVGADGTANSAVQLSNTRAGKNHFTISGVDLGTNDFTISVKININQLTTKTDSSNYLFGIGNLKDAAEGYFNVAYKKNGDYNQIKLRVNGATHWVGYAPEGEYAEFRIVREGNTVTFYISPDGKTNAIKVTTVTLNSTESLALSNYDIGFSSNVGCQNPGDFPAYYDDIRIYDCAMYLGE